MTKLKINTTALINMAKVCQSRAGNYEVMIDIPNVGTCLVDLCQRPDGFGGSVTDVMRVDTIDECVAKRTLNSKQLARVEDLIAEAESKTAAEMRRIGWAV